MILKVSRAGRSPVTARRPSTMRLCQTRLGRHVMPQASLCLWFLLLLVQLQLAGTATENWERPRSLQDRRGDRITWLDWAESLRRLANPERAVTAGACWARPLHMQSC